MPYKILGKDYAMIAVGLVYEREQEAQKAAGTRS